MIVAIVAGLLVLAGLAYWFTQSRPAELPSGDDGSRLPSGTSSTKPKAEEPKAKVETKAAASEAKAPEAKPAVAPPKAEPIAEPAKAEPKPEAAPAASEPVRVDVPAEPAKPARPSAPPTKLSLRPRRDGEALAAFRRGLANTRGGFIARLAAVFGGRKELSPELLDEIQTVLLTADIGPRTSQKLIDKLKERRVEPDQAWDVLREEATQILGPSPGGIQIGQNPTVILVVGVNGVGKTTTIGKLASRLKDDGRKVVLAAGDTFRAAAVLQLEVWGKRVGCTVVKGKDRADPAAVIFDAIKQAETEGADVVLADTAGRLHNKSNLMEELKKVVRTAEKALGRPLDEILLVLDSTTGQNASQQAQLFREAIPVSGIVLTKLDGTAKGGVVLGITDEHRTPIRYIGIGERVEDLRDFETEAFLEALFERPEETPTVEA